MSIDDTLVMILAGGEGKRLFPLTQDRAKPAVPFGGRYRIIDFVLNNFINSGFFKIKVLTQYKSDSLNQHIARSWPTGVEILSIQGNKGEATLKVKKLTGSHTLINVGDYENDISMIQEADIGCAVANDGVIMRPYIVEKAVNSKGLSVLTNIPAVCVLL